MRQARFQFVDSLENMLELMELNRKYFCEFIMIHVQGSRMFKEALQLKVWGGGGIMISIGTPFLKRYQR